MQSSWVKAILIVALAHAPATALAQHGSGMMGGGHDHGQGHDPEATTTKSESREDRKARESVSKLLSAERSRNMLLDGILADTEFMRLLAYRIAADPGWRAIFLTRIETAGGGTATVPVDSTGPGGAGSTPRLLVAMYRCPMHPEVAANAPGKCPKCGMTLERSER